MAQTPREYDIIVLGATGYTAKIVAEYINTNLPTNLKWAIAGRSEQKLEGLANRLRAMNGDRQSPGIVVLDLKKEQLSKLADRCRLIINGIGPYHLHSSPVIDACANAGTHYVGFSLETPWVQEMIMKYDSIAKNTGSIIIPTIALAPSDIVAYLVAITISEQLQSRGTARVDSTAKLKIQGMSGGSLNTVISLMSSYGVSWIFPGNPWSLTQAPTHTNVPSKTPLLSRIFGYRFIEGLGICTTSFLAICNESIAHRSAALLPQIYGPCFHFHEFLPVPGFFNAALVHFLTRLGLLVLSIPPLRKLFEMLIPPGGTGPDLSNAHVERQVFHAVGQPASEEGNMIEARFSYEGSLYYCSAAMGVEAALVVLGGESVLAHDIGGGILTPATLGMPFVERLRNIGVELAVNEMT